MSWHGPSAPRVEGIATKSLVVASCASKLSSMASRILCLVSLAFIPLLFRLSLLESGPRQYTARQDFARYGDTDGRQPQCPVSHHRRAGRRGRRAWLQSLPDQEGTGRPADQCRSKRPQDPKQVNRAAYQIMTLSLIKHLLLLV